MGTLKEKKVGNFSVLYMQPARFDFYTSTRPDLLTFEYPQHLVMDMEVTDIRDLQTLIQTWMLEKKLTVSPLVVIFSPDMTFTQDLPGQTDQDIELKRFSDMVPFDYVSSKITQIGERFRIISINRSLYDGVVGAFEAKGFETRLVVPWDSLIAVTSNLKWGVECAAWVHDQIDRLKTVSFLTPSVEPQGMDLQRRVINKHPKVVAALTVGSLAMTIATAFYTLRQPSPRPKSAQASIVVPSPTLSPTPSPTPKPLSAITVAIQTPNTKGAMVTKLQQQLVKSGFVSIDVAKSSVVSKTAILTTLPTLTASPSALLESALKTIDPNVVIKQAPDLSTDVLIVLPR